MSAADRTWLSAADTAKLVRKALKADFPGVKFSVRSSTYAGGASIDVSWTDGPMVQDVDRTIKLYEGSHGEMNGGDTIKMPHDSLLMTDDGPTVVHFGADYVFSNRRVSDARTAVYRHELRRFLKHIGEDATKLGHQDRIPVSGHHYCGAEGPATLSHDSSGEWASTVIHQLAYGRRWLGEQCPGSDTAYCEGCGRWQKGHEKEPHLR